MSAAVTLPEPVWQRALAVLSDAPAVVLACHVGPDADALGSMLALGAALRTRGAAVSCSWGDDPVQPPPDLGFLPGGDLLVQPADVPAAPDVLVTLDTSSRDRLGGLRPAFDAAGCTVVVDHHARGDGFGDVRLVDPSAAATALIVEELIDRLGVPLTRDLATCLYAGLAADTGSFRFASTTPAVHAVAARLLATGIRHDDISRRLFDTHSTGYLRLLSEVLDRLVVEPDAVGGRGLAWTWTCPGDLQRFAVHPSEVEALIATVRSVREADVAVVCKATPDGGHVVSARSRGAVDVGAACAALGGGGHALAAGFTSPHDRDTTVQRLREALEGTRAGR